MKYFKCAAILYKDNDGNLIERRGRRHHEIIRAIYDNGEIDLYKKWHVEGFIYGEQWTAQFVCREEATEIAKNMGIPMIGCVLTSEDLW